MGSSARRGWAGLAAGLLLGAAAGRAGAADGPRFPKPDPAGALAEYKTFLAPGDPLRPAAEDWDGARERASRPEWRGWLDGRRREVDDWMARRRDRVEWRSGWHHDFVSPRDGSFLIWTPDEPGPDTLRSKSDPSVPLTPTLHDAWVYRFRTTNASTMIEAARLHRLTGEPRYAEWAASQLDFYAENYLKFPRRPQPRPGSRMMFQSLDEATMTSRLIEVVRLLGDFPAPARRKAWFDGYFGPQCELLGAHLRSIHNIACWHRSAAAQVALVYGDEAIWKEAVDGPYGIRRQVREGITGDYLWYEQSLGYNAYATRALMPVFAAAWLAGRADELRDEMLAVQNLVVSPLTLRFPDGRLPTPADSGRSRAPDPQWLAEAARLFPNPIGLAEAARRRSWETLLDPIAPPAGAGAGRSEPPPATSRDLESSRMAVLVADGWQVFFHYGQLTASHTQAEALNFEAAYRGIDVTHDAGTVGYGSPLHKGWYGAAASHNVPMAGGQGQAGWHPGRKLGFAADSASADQPKYRPGATASRTLAIRDGVLVDEATIASHPDAGAPAAPAGLALHLQGEAELSDAFRPDPAFADALPGPFRHWKSPRTAESTDRAEVPVTIAGRRFRVVFETPGPFRLTHATTPDAPPGRRQSFYLQAAGPAATFRTTIAPPGPG